MTDYHYDNDPNETYGCLLSIGDKASPGLDGTLSEVWTDDLDGTVTNSALKLSTSVLQLESTNKIQFDDANAYINASASGVFDINVSTEVNIDTTTLDVNANADISGTLGVTGIATFTAQSVHSAGIKTGAAIISDTTNTDALGSASVTFADLFLGDGAFINFGEDQDVSLLHVHNTGLRLSSSDQLQIGGAGEYLSGDGTDLSIVSGGAVNLTAAAASILKTSDGSLTIHADGADDKVLIKGDNASGVAVELLASHVDGDVKITAGATSGILDVDGYDLDVDIGAGGIDILSANAIDIDTSGAGENIVLDAQAGSVYIDGGESAAAAVSLSATSSHANTTILISSVGTGASAIDIDSSGGFDLDVVKGVTIDCAALSIDSTDTTNLTMTANSGSNKTMTISTTNAGGGNGLIDIDADGNITIDTTDTSAGIDIGTATSGVPINIGNGTSETTVADNLTVSGDCAVTGTLTSGTYAPNVITLTHASDPILTLTNQEESNVQNARHSKIIFTGETGGGAGHQLASIIADHDSSDSNYDGGLYLYTNDGADSDDALTQRLYVDNAGNAQFNTHIGIPRGNKIYLDGADCSGDTYLYEKTADEVVLVCGGEEIRIADATGTGTNTIYGVDAGKSLDANSDENVFIGAYCADGSLSGADKNVGVGNLSLSALTSGDSNVALGWSSLLKTSSGSYNTGVGYEAMYENLTGQGNSAVGYESLYTNTGSYNTGLGNRTLYTNAGGQYGVAVGYDALHDNTSGNNNVGVGARALYENEGGSDNVAIGYSAGEHDDAAADVVTATQCVIIGSEADFQTTTPTNEIVIGYNANGIADNYAVIGNASITRVYAADDVGATLYAGSATVQTSDKRIKEDIKDSVLGLDFIKKLRSIEYKKRQPIDYDESLKKELGWYKRGASPRILGEIDKTKSRVGFIAQEVGAVLKDLGFDDNNDIVEIDETNTQQMIAYSKLVPPLVKAVQELSAKVEALENQ